MPSLALRAATLLPLICEVMRLAIDIPAASSLALLIRRPVAKRCNEVARPDCDMERLRCALTGEMLVLIYDAMVILQNWECGVGDVPRFTLVCFYVLKQSHRS